MDRREFLRKMVALGGTVTAGSLVQACDRSGWLDAPATATPPPDTLARSTVAPVDPTAEPTASPTSTPGLAAGTVALVSTTDRADGVRRAIELLGVNPVSGRHVLLKPNFNSADPAPGSTHVDVLRALGGSLNDMGARSITVGDRSGMGATGAVMRQLGVFEMAPTFGFEPVAFDELPDDHWEIFGGDGYHWSRGFPVPKMLREAECIVQTCNLKTHRHGGHFSLSLKNSVGFVAKRHESHNYMSELHTEPGQRQMIAEINASYEPSLVVLDGVEAFVRGGPGTGTSAATGIVLAGTDRVALDAVGVAVLRLFGTTDEVSRGRVFEQAQIARAVELGLGVDEPGKIAFAVGDADGEAYAARIRDVLLA